jgi:SAM-dependent methyltransferase
MNCLYCESTRMTSINGMVFSCNYCHSLTTTEPEIIYPSKYHAYKKSFFTPKIYFLLRKALKCGLKRNLTIADIGCGSGHALFWAKLFNCKTIGWDVSTDVIPSGHIKYSQWDNLEEEQANQCDAVWCWHTIEHSNTPTKMLESIYTILKPGGKLYLEFPESFLLQDLHPLDLNKWASFPEHRGIPSRPWVIWTADRIGYKVIKTEQPMEGRWMYLKFGKHFIYRVVLQK